MRGLIENSLSTSSVLSDDTAFKLGILTTRIISAELVLKIFSCLNVENISCIFPPFEMGDVSKCIWRATGTNADGSAGHKKRDSPIPPSPGRPAAHTLCRSWPRCTISRFSCPSICIISQPPL